MRFSDIKIGYRLLLVVLAGLVGTVVVAGLELNEIHKNLTAAKQNQTRSLVDGVVSMLGHYRAQEASGAMSRDEAQAAAKGAIAQMRYEGEEYFFVIDAKPTMVLHPIKPELNGKSLTEFEDKAGKKLFVEMAGKASSSAGSGFVSYYWTKPGSDEPVPKLSFVKKFTPWGWIVGSGVYIDDIDAIYRENLLYTIVLVAIALIVIGGASLLISRAITRPLGGVTRNMLRLAKGDLDIRVEHSDAKSEIGDLRRALEVFHGNAVEMERMRAEQETLKRAAEAERRRAALALADDFERDVMGVVETVSTSAGQMRSDAETLSALSDNVSNRSGAVSVATEEASASVQTVASATEELSASIGEISRRVSQASEIAGNAVNAVRTSNSKIQGLADAVAKIGEVVDLITDIAEQTNLLALNATIEAARAGDAGKGFAVVASEVKNLANQTARATEEIGAQISAIQSASGEAVDAIRNIETIIDEINEVSATIASAVEEQSAATREISRNIQQAAAGTQEVATNVVDVRQSAGEAETASRSVLGAATSLMEGADRLRHDVDGFLGQIRSDANAAAA